MSDSSSPGPPPEPDYQVQADSVGAGSPGPAADYNVVANSIGPGSPGPATDYNVVANTIGPGSPGPAVNYSVAPDTVGAGSPGPATVYTAPPAASAGPFTTPPPKVATTSWTDSTDYAVKANSASAWSDPTNYDVTKDVLPANQPPPEPPEVSDRSGGGWKFPGMNPLLLNPVVDQSEFTMYPPIASNFMVAIDGVSCGIWTEMSGLAMEYTGKPWQEGGQVTSDWLLQPRKQQTLTLTRPIGPASIEMLAWFQLYGHIIIPLTAFVGLCDFQGNVCYWWELMGVTPLKWTGPKGKAGDPQAATETLVLTYTDFLAYGPGPGLGTAGAIGAAIGAGVGIAATVGEAVISALTAPKLSSSSSSSGGGGLGGAISGGLSSLVGGDGITFDIVPQTYKMSQQQSLPAPTTPGAKGGSQPPHFKGANPRTLNFTAIFDCMTLHITNPLEMVSAFTNGVQPQLDYLWGCMAASPDSLGSDQPLPPTVKFTWGSLSFVGYMKQLGVQVDVFRIDGTPMRATVTIDLQESAPQTKGQNPTSAASGANKTHTVVAGDSLASIAYAAFGRADYWRAIANLNGIDDPMRVKPGTSLLLPKPMLAKAIA